MDKTPRLTRRQAAIITAYTGIALGPIEDLKAYAREKLGRTHYLHDMATDDFWLSLKRAALEDVLAIAAEDNDQ